MTEAVALRITPRANLAQEWALVLVAEGLHPRVQRGPQWGFALVVPGHEADRGLALLEAYDRENPRSARPAGRSTSPALIHRAALIVAAAFLGFFAITGPWVNGVVWFDRGGADAARILDGELWRTVTALTLHADLGHALGNAIAAVLFLGAVCVILGPGVGCALVLLAGALGNWLTAYLYGSFHVAVGASTAVFGAVGVLSGLSTAGRLQRGDFGHSWLPFAGAIALLAMLGVGSSFGVRVDVWAHFFGLVVGYGVGIPMGLLFVRPPGWVAQALFGAGALATLTISWDLALRQAV